MQPEDALSTETFTSRFNRIISALLVGFAVVFTGVTALYRPEQAGRTFVGALLFAVIVHALLWRPRLAVDDEGVTVINVLSTVHVPWEALIAIEGRFSLVLRTPNRSVSVWCAPVAGKSTVYRSRRGEDRTTGAPVVDGRRRPPAHRFRHSRRPGPRALAAAARGGPRRHRPSGDGSGAPQPAPRRARDHRRARRLRGFGARPRHLT
jgi:hypothetical protein